MKIVPAYAPRSGETEKIAVGVDLNGHVAKNPGVFQRVHGGKGYGQRNREGGENLGKHGEPRLSSTKRKSI